MCTRASGARVEGEKASEFCLSLTGQSTLASSPEDSLRCSNTAATVEVVVRCLVTCVGLVVQGYGVMSFPSGNRYEGAFEVGKFHGYGVFYAASGMKYEVRPWPSRARTCSYLEP